LPLQTAYTIFRGTFHQKGLVFICFSCLQDILRARAEANAPCYRLFLHNQTVSISECQVILQKQARKYDKHAKNR